MVKTSVIFNVITADDFERSIRYKGMSEWEYDNELLCAKFTTSPGVNGSYVRYVSGIYLHEGDSIKFDFEAIANDDDGVSVILDYSGTNKEATNNPVFTFKKITGNQFENINGEFSVNKSGYYNINIGKFKDDGGILYLRNVMVELQTINANNRIVDWLDLTPSTGFDVYSDIYGFAYKRVGDVVTIQGALTNNRKMDWNSDSNAPVLTVLPEEIRPNKRIALVMHGSGTTKWLLIMYTDGRMTVNRYNDNSGVQASSLPVTSWLNVNVTYMV